MGNLFRKKEVDDPHMLRVVVDGGRVRLQGASWELIAHPRTAIVMHRLRKLRSALPRGEFSLYIGDWYEWECDRPILVFSKRRGEENTIAIPDSDMLGSYEALDKEIDQAVAWDEKVEMGYWRGATTGGDFRDPRWRNFPRSRLVRYSLQNGDVVDARFSHDVQGGYFLHGTEMMDRFVSSGEMLKHKYLIDVDGNAATFSRFYMILRSNCVPFKVESEQEQWYYADLRPYEHYVPVKRDLSNLREQVEWARMHDAECRGIAEQGSAFAKRYFTKSHINQFLIETIEKLHNYGQ
jgi:hypothetical protein